MGLSGVRHSSRLAKSFFAAHISTAAAQKPIDRRMAIEAKQSIRKPTAEYLLSRQGQHLRAWKIWHGANLLGM